MYAKNGSVPTQASEGRLRPELSSGRGAPSTSSDVIGYAPIFAGQSVAMIAFAFVCWPLFAKLIFA